MWDVGNYGRESDWERWREGVENSGKGFVGTGMALAPSLSFFAFFALFLYGTKKESEGANLILQGMGE